MPPRRNPAGGAVPLIIALPPFDSAAAAAPMLRANNRITDDIVVRITCAHQLNQLRRRMVYAVSIMRLSVCF